MQSFLIFREKLSELGVSAVKIGSIINYVSQPGNFYETE